MSSGAGDKRLDVNDTLVVKTPSGGELPFVVMALLEDEEEGSGYAVLLHEPEDGEESFIVTDPYGKLLEDDALAQDVLDDYLDFAGESEDGDA
ncbi:MAG TPA: hypothetical protein VMV82_09925 [Candidatus Dormibacteraeota bacterium]|nr:hypothetical protein [Candidatus Dormibacteraeota bacterium]